LPVPAIGAGDVYYDEFTSPMRLEPYCNWTFYCPGRPGCPKDCQRTMGVVPRNMKLLKSNLQPLAFLHAWRDCVIDPEKGHRKSPVPDADVRSFFEDHEDELSEIAVSLLSVVNFQLANVLLVIWKSTQSFRHIIAFARGLHLRPLRRRRGVCSDVY
jgi:hypothetical protein